MDVLVLRWDQVLSDGIDNWIEQKLLMKIRNSLRFNRLFKMWRYYLKLTWDVFPQGSKKKFNNNNNIIWQKDRGGSDEDYVNGFRVNVETKEIGVHKLEIEEKKGVCSNYTR